MVHRRSPKKLKERLEKNREHNIRTYGVPSFSQLKRFNAPRLAGRRLYPVKTTSLLDSHQRDALRNAVRMCELCSWGRIPDALVIHHKDRNPTNNIRENLMVLCRNCHYLLHRGLIKEPK